MDLAEQDFDIVCKKFMTVCLTQCPVLEVISWLQTVTVLWPCLTYTGSPQQWIGRNKFLLRYLMGKLTRRNPNRNSFCLKGLNMESVCTIRVFHTVHESRKSTGIHLRGGDGYEAAFRD